MMTSDHLCSFALFVKISVLFFAICQSKQSTSDRSNEFESLVHRSRDCVPEGREHSGKWSCIRRIPDEELAGFSTEKGNHCHRGPRSEDGKCRFGFLTGREAGTDYKRGVVEDHKFMGQIPGIPDLTGGPGYLRMNMTKLLREKLLPWYAANKDRQGKERVVPGGFMNNHVYPSHLVYIGMDRSVFNAVNTEMEAVLTWWTGGKQLKHTSTYGVRVYQRHNMLLTHVDDRKGHLASAVLQVDQQVDEVDGGWPLEVVSANGSHFDVYLQPGEMVLYEGARIKHGRPMRFRGDSFANLFVHFSVHGWDGQEFNSHTQQTQQSSRSKEL